MYRIHPKGLQPSRNQLISSQDTRQALALPLLRAVMPRSSTRRSAPSRPVTGGSGTPCATIQGVDTDLDKLALILAQRLAAVVPDGFHVEAAAGMLWYSADEGKFPGQDGSYRVGRSGTYVRDNFGALGQTDEERTAGVVAQALDELQDYISEATHDPWPGQRAQPRARAQVRGRMLLAWYEGTEPSSGVVLAIEPVPLAELQRRPGHDQDAQSTE